MEEKKKSGRTIIKCTRCGFKYYDGDAHKCGAFMDPKSVGVVTVEEKDKKEKETAEVKDVAEEKVGEKPKEKKQPGRSQKESFKIKW